MHLDFALLLKIPAPWKIASVNTYEDGSRLDAFVEHDQGTLWTCPHCVPSEPALTCHDHMHMRKWRHLNFFDAKCYLHARIPQVVCKKHGVVQIPIPWADSDAQITYEMEKKVITDLLTCRSTTALARHLELSLETLQEVKERASKSGRVRK